MKNKQKGNMYNWKLPNINILSELYLKGLSCKQLALDYHVTPSAIKNKLNRHGIKLRSYAEAQKLASNHIQLSEEAMDFINGLLLGDGSLVLTKERKSACYRHSDKRREYIEFLKNKLISYGIEITSVNSCKRGYHYLQTKFYRDFVEIRNKWYPNGTKIVPSDIELKPLTILNWFIGDGSYFKANISNSEKLSIAMQFDRFGKDLLSKKLKMLGIPNSTYPDCIYIKKEGRGIFFNLISQLERPSCYNYKFNGVKNGS